jgi:hypothetical protein
LRVWGFGLRVEGLVALRVEGEGLRVAGLVAFRVEGLVALRVQRPGFWVE